MTTVEFTASGTWLCPTGVTALDSVICIGKGGDGGAYTSGKTGGGGGGYSQTSSVAVTAGVTYTITVDSTKSAFGADVVRANAGPNGANDQSVTAGASTSGAVGTVKYGGGQSGYVWTSEGGGGGGAGGPSGTGGSGNGRTGGTGNGTDAGNGGIGGWLQYGGVPAAGNGTSYGGGGGGGATGKPSGTGGPGLVRISYTQAVSLTADPAEIEVEGQAVGLTVSAKLTAAAAALTVRGIGANLEQPTTVYRVQLEWSPTSIVDITDRVLQAGWERSLSNYSRGLEIGTADVTLENDDGGLSPLNLPAGVFRPGAGLTIEAAPIEGDPYKTIFTGYVDTIRVAPALSSPRNVTLSCRDRMRDMSSRRIDTAVMTEVNVGSLMAVVLDAAAISVRSIDLIGDSVPFAWFRDRQVTGVVADVIDAGGYSAYVSGDGTFRFRDRFFDLGGTVAASYHEYSALTWELNDADVVNSILVRGEPRTIVEQLQDVAELSEVISIPASESRGFWLEYQDPRNQENAPAIGVVTPVASIDWILNDQADNSGAVLTGSCSITFAAFAETCVATLTNGSASTAYLTRFAVRGMPIQREPYVSVQGNDTASQSLYGIRDDTLETRLLGTQDRLTGRAADILDLYAEPTPRVSMTLVNRWPDVVDIDLADIVHLSEPHAGLADQFTVSRVSHQIDAEARGWVHSVTYELDRSKAVSPLILDDAADGILDSDRLGRATA